MASRRSADRSKNFQRSVWDIGGGNHSGGGTITITGNGTEVIVSKNGNLQQGKKGCTIEDGVNIRHV